jgi:hypothetical protein
VTCKKRGNEVNLLARCTLWNIFVSIFQDVIDEYVERMKRRGSMYKAIDPTYLKWTPFVAPAATGPTWYLENAAEVSREEGKTQLAVKALWIVSWWEVQASSCPHL